jgi:AraC-like DNA-binding protein
MVLRIEDKALQRYLGVLIGRHVDKELTFRAVTTSNPAIGSLRRAVFHFASDYNARGNNLSDLVKTETERILIMKFLISNWHNYTHLLLRQPPQSTPSTVRKVEEYIEANWDKPIDIEALAGVADVSARSLFRQFRKDRGYSPATFIKRVRLNRAKEMLERANGSTITEIAYQCGFQNAGHFARDFRLAFGELPSDTVRRLNGRKALSS